MLSHILHYLFSGHSVGFRVCILSSMGWITLAGPSYTWKFSKGVFLFWLIALFFLKIFSFFLMTTVLDPKYSAISFALVRSKTASLCRKRFTNGFLACLSSGKILYLAYTVDSDGAHGKCGDVYLRT